MIGCTLRVHIVAAAVQERMANYPGSCVCVCVCVYVCVCVHTQYEVEDIKRRLQHLTISPHPEPVPMQDPQTLTFKIQSHDAASVVAQLSVLASVRLAGHVARAGPVCVYVTCPMTDEVWHKHQAMLHRTATRIPEHTVTEHTVTVKAQHSTAHTHPCKSTSTFVIAIATQSTANVSVPHAMLLCLCRSWTRCSPFQTGTAFSASLAAPGLWTPPRTPSSAATSRPRTTHGIYATQPAQKRSRASVRGSTSEGLGWAWAL